MGSERPIQGLDSYVDEMETFAQLDLNQPAETDMERLNMSPWKLSRLTSDTNSREFVEIKDSSHKMESLRGEE
jgi:hypothetical protein